MHPSDDDPLPVRIVPTQRYDDTPEGEIRLAFDAWVLRVLIVLYVIASLVQ